MTTGYRIELDDGDVRAALGRLLAAAEDMTPLMDLLGAHLTQTTRERFEDGKGPDGTPWPPSARATAQGGQTLVDSARLLGSIGHEAGRAYVEVGTNVIYAAIHQRGGTIRARSGGKLKFRIGGAFVAVDSVTMPARPFLGVSAEDVAEIRLIVNDYLSGAAGAAP